MPNRISVFLGFLYTVDLNASSVAGEFLINTDVNIIISSHIDLQEL